MVIDVHQAQQYSPPRIMSHEIGHILGLADNYNGDCSLLMSGGSAGAGCTNPYPRSDEAALVDYFFSGPRAEEVGAEVFRDSRPAKVAVAKLTPCTDRQPAGVSGDVAVPYWPDTERINAQLSEAVCVRGRSLGDRVFNHPVKIRYT